MGIDASISFFTFYHYTRFTFLLFVLLVVMITADEQLKFDILPPTANTARLYLIHLTTLLCMDIIFTAAKKLAFLMALKLFRYFIQSFTIMFIIPAVGHIIYSFWNESKGTKSWERVLNFEPYSKVSSNIVHEFGQILRLIGEWGTDGMIWYSPHFPCAKIMAGINFVANAYLSYESVLGKGSHSMAKFHNNTNQITIETVLLFLGSFLVVKGIDRIGTFITRGSNKTRDIFTKEALKPSSAIGNSALSDDPDGKEPLHENSNPIFPKRRPSSRKSVSSKRSQNFTSPPTFSSASFYNECFGDRLDSGRPVSKSSDGQTPPYSSMDSTFPDSGK